MHRTCIRKQFANQFHGGRGGMCPVWGMLLAIGSLMGDLVPDTFNANEPTNTFLDKIPCPTHKCLGCTGNIGRAKRDQKKIGKL